MMSYDEFPRLSFAINFNSKGHPLGPRMSGKLRTPLPPCLKELKNKGPSHIHKVGGGVVVAFSAFYASSTHY